ncbi:metallophosphoesterase [Tuwongella immobilis]|uniref:Calcineurin-like phosphoesterase domain-containing protein n=1 Tax=Tuwongella immobilis TaxID=692036 RepID=A0A6C2YS13_9BACT|nr:metallophosphoesterase [Tuwongella immobilis]VIP03672.1 uncharacterized metallophosphoesterase ykue : Metallophosphoesterase OS=uncultured planctomycete GN=HGMM_F11F07C07 PE=4 SV=1: Metallophos [Tuwongella immobilis]VTS04712.1 uncharacterized metallophosphoesterase ykue : Metallophosphoesterase OS=uncultured planctomycete GN=HGMM_F11F07C07 PE=4 SV=1: Metallophos [Tuwongella immobilis]
MKQLPQIHDRSSRLARFLGRNWARVTYARHIEPTWLEINELPITIPDLPAAFAGMRIAHLSDLHDGHQLPRDYLPRTMDQVMDLQPDLIALTGDFIHKGYHHVEQIARTVGRLSAPLGVFAVLGNHDFSVRNALGVRRYPKLHRAIADALAANGVTVLRNETHPLLRDGQRIDLCGLDDLWSRECFPDRAFAGLSDRTPRIVMAHNPQTIHLVEHDRMDLMLSGHTHGGQIDWPGLGRIVLGKQAKRLAAGLYRMGDSRWLYVSKGVGYGFRFRFNVRPEVAILQLTPEQSAHSAADSASLAENRG